MRRHPSLLTCVALAIAVVAGAVTASAALDSARNAGSSELAGNLS